MYNGWGILHFSPFDWSQNMTSEISNSLRGRGMLLLLLRVFRIPGSNVVLPTYNKEKMFHLVRKFTAISLIIGDFTLL